ncbi:hypothetical protein ACNKHQ_18360 [Shigella flexneri]
MPGEVLEDSTRTRILNKPMNMQLIGDAQPCRERSGRSFGGECCEVVVASVANVVKAVAVSAVQRREGGRGDGRRFSGERRDGGNRAPRRDDAGAAPRL